MLGVHYTILKEQRFCKGKADDQGRQLARIPRLLAFSARAVSRTPGAPPRHFREIPTGGEVPSNLRLPHCALAKGESTQALVNFRRISRAIPRSLTDLDLRTLSPDELTICDSECYRLPVTISVGGAFQPSITFPLRKDHFALASLRV
jgi:hypothetical protein